MYTRRMILAGVAAVLAGSVVTTEVSAGARVEHPETIFAKGMKWSERNGQNKGTLLLRPGGSALINWNGTTYSGKWEKVDEYRVRTTWESGGPPGNTWSIRQTGNPTVPYIASRGQP